MSEPETTETANQPLRQERCLCREVLEQFRESFGLPPEVRDHFNNSCIEFLRGLRAIIDSRIEHLSKPSTHGTKIAVE
jgi:hypothetical protein